MNDSYHIEELEIRISNYLSGNCTEEEKEALFAYLASNEDAAKIFREMSAVWAVSSVPAFAKVEDANLSQIKEKIAAAEMKPVRSRKIVPVWLKVAAAIILLLGCNYFWYTYTENLTEYIRMRILLMKLKCRPVRGRILCFRMEQRFH